MLAEPPLNAYQIIGHVTGREGDANLSSMLILHKRPQRLIDGLIGGKRGADFRSQASQIGPCPILLIILAADRTLQFRQVVFGAKFVGGGIVFIRYHVPFSHVSLHDER